MPRNVPDELTLFPAATPTGDAAAVTPLAYRLRPDSFEDYLGN